MEKNPAMDLSNYSPPRQDISAGVSGTISVRGLNLEDVALLMEAHQAKLLTAFATFEALRAQPDMDDMRMFSALALGLVREAPDVAADIIALAADQPDASAGARKLSFSMQVHILVAVARLTFEAGGGLGELLAALKLGGRGLGIEIERNQPASQASRQTS